MSVTACPLIDHPRGAESWKIRYDGWKSSGVWGS